MLNLNEIPRDPALEEAECLGCGRPDCYDSDCNPKYAEAGANDDEEAEEDDFDTEPPCPHDLSDDAEALASCGWGTDEDYGCYGED